jgi:hypothetical protein
MGQYLYAELSLKGTGGPPRFVTGVTRANRDLVADQSQ